MRTFLFVGPNLLAGIGQVTKRYADILGAEYCEYGKTPTREEYDIGFAFVLPVSEQLINADVLMTRCRKRNYMTICETETVHPAYGVLSKYKSLWVSSKFCQKVLSRQFPETEWKLLHLYAKPNPPLMPIRGEEKPYVFYTIGNIIDPRKNINSLLRAFMECKFSNAKLLLKATCNRKLVINEPNVQLIQGLLSDDQMDKIHAGCDCYINCSHSEGVGMGAVEAALRKKPVIITDYGGLKEYVQTPWTVPCKKKQIGFNDFLFTSDLEWGDPNYEELKKCMMYCYENRIREYDHEHTKNLMDTLRVSLESSLR